MNAVDNEAFPTNLRFYSAISEAPLLQRSFSSDNDVMSYRAVSIFFLVFFDLASNKDFSSIYFVKVSCKLASKA